jgi:hypothetical protein
LDGGPDEEFIQAMLDDDRLFRRLMGEEKALLWVSPWLFFTVLLHRARRDLEREAFTVERRSSQKVVVFDADQVIQLLEQEPLQDYLAAMLASFARNRGATSLSPQPADSATDEGSDLQKPGGL